MRVLYYHQHFSTPDGKTGTRSYEFARHLVERGHQVTMICGSYGAGRSGLSGNFQDGKREGIVHGIEVIEFALPYSNQDRFIKRGLTFLRFAWRSTRVAFARQYDLIFATSTPLTAGIPGIVASLLRRKPFVFEVRDLWPELPREMGVIKNPIVLAGLGFLEWASYHSAKGHVGLSPGIVQGIHRRTIPKDKIRMIPNGCDLDLFKPNDERVQFGGLKDNEFVAIFTGAHGIANGLDAVLDAALELKRRNRKDIRLVFMGEGMLKQKLRERADRDGLDNCLFLKPVSKRELAHLLGRVDVGMQILSNIPAFYYGTSPNKFFDYISSGLPVLNNYPGWLAELIQEHKCGIAVPPDNSAAFADGLEYMADHKSELAQMGTNARALAESQFDRAKLANKFVDFLEEVVQK